MEPTGFNNTSTQTRDYPAAVSIAVLKSTAGTNLRLTPV